MSEVELPRTNIDRSRSWRIFYGSKLIDTIKGCVDQNRIVRLVSSFEVPITPLASRVGWEMSKDTAKYPDGIWMIEFADVQDTNFAVLECFTKGIQDYGLLPLQQSAKDLTSFFNHLADKSETDNALIDFLEKLTPSDLTRFASRLPNGTKYMPQLGTHYQQVEGLVAYIRSPTGPEKDQIIAALSVLKTEVTKLYLSVEHLVRDLSSKTLVLILDDCDNCIGGVRSLMEHLIKNCPHIRILVTSNKTELSSLANEYEFVIDPIISIKETLFSGHRFFGWYFTLDPSIFFIFNLCLFTVLIGILSVWAGVHSLHFHNPNTGFDGNVGIFYKWNWGLSYIVVLPVIFTTLTMMFREISNSIMDLCSRKRKVIVNKSGGVAWEYPWILAQRIRRKSRYLSLICLCLSLLFTILTTWNLWNGILHGDNFASNIIPDWDNAWRKDPNHQWQITPANINRAKNIIYDLVAYTCQTFVVFVGFFSVYKLALFFEEFVRLLKQRKTQYRFEPWLADPDYRLGLKPMAPIFNHYMRGIIMFEAFLFFHRLQIIAQHKQPVLTYASYVIFNILKVSSENVAKIFALDALNIGEKAGLFLLLIPILVLGYFPLFKLRKYLSPIKSRLAADYGRKFNDAKSNGNSEDVKLYQAQLQMVKEAEIWPNGDGQAMRLLYIVGILAIAAAAPPFIIFLPLAFLITLNAWKNLSRKVWGDDN